MMRYLLFSLLSLLSLFLAGCPAQVYGPCLVVQDCDPATADACHQAPGADQGTCTLICLAAQDCPPGPSGEQASCIPAGASAGPKICSI